MKRLLFVSIATALLVASTSLRASQEAVVAFTNLHFESQGIGESESVIIDANQSHNGVQRFSVRAFGKLHQLTDLQLKALGAGQYNSVQVNCEGGYRELGGRTIYIKISMAFNSGEVRSKTIVIKEAGSVEVKDRP